MRTGVHNGVFLDNPQHQSLGRFCYRLGRRRGVPIFATWVALLGIGVRRLHDRGKHGFWIGLYYPVPFILAIAAMDPNGQRDVLDWVALAILAWAIIDLGILKGRPAPIAA